MRDVSAREAIKVISLAVKTWWADWANQVLVCLAAVLLSLTLIGYPLAVFGLFGQSKDLLDGLRSGLGGFWATIKKDWKNALLWGLLNTLVLATSGFGVWFYANTDFAVARVVVFVPAILAILWGAWQCFSLGAYFQQEPRTLQLAWRNGWAILIGRPAFSWLVALVVLVVLALSLRLFIPLFFAFPSLLASVCLAAVRETITNQS